MIIDVADPSQVHGARSAAANCARGSGLDDTGVGRVALITTEMATNLVKHSAGGKIVVSSFQDASGTGVELLSIDSGSGIGDVERAMRDGHSTAGSMGGGLGAIRRLADVFDIFSPAGRGTIIVARVAVAKRSRPPPGASMPIVGCVVAPHRGEVVAGDSWAFEMTPDGPIVMLVDGSGHGVHAEAASISAVETFRENCERPCVQLLEAIHRALAPTRGGAVSVAKVVVAEHVVRYAGIGNISGALVTNETTKKMVSNNGVAGHVVSRIREFIYPYDGVATIILHSDGLSTRWDLGIYPGIQYRHPSAVAAALFRDHARGRDDAAVLALRI